MPQTVNGIHNALAAIKAAGWDQVTDGNNETFLVEDITLDPNSDDLTGEYLVEGDAVVAMRDGLRERTIWTRAE